MSEWFYVYTAYGLTWLTFAAYALYVHMRGRRVTDAAPSSSHGDRA